MLTVATQTKQKSPGIANAQRPAPRPQAAPHSHLGNQARLRLTAVSIQPKLTIGAVNDPLERAADETAEQVMRMPDPATPTIQRKCGTCMPCEDETLRRQPASTAAPNPSPSLAPASIATALATPGTSLPPAARAFFEPRFGRDFGDIQIHTDDHAATSAQEIGAHAYTAGQQIVFARDRYDPASSAGRRLLAHELAHTIQQSTGAAATIRRAPAPTTQGKVLFIQVDRAANTIAFVTESGTLTYTLLKPTELAVGSYDFAASVTPQGLSLTAPATVTSMSPFQYRIAAGQPNPATLLAGVPKVSVMVIESGPGATPANPGATPAAAADQPTSVAVTYEATPLDDPSPGLPSSYSLPGLSGIGTGAGLGLHNLAFNNLSWLDGPANPSYWGALVPSTGIELDRSLDSIPRDLSPKLDTYKANLAPGEAPSWKNSMGRTVEFQPDPASPLTRAFTADELLSIDSLTRRYNAAPSSLSAAELQLLREAARVHIGASTPAAPFSSYSKPGEQVSWTSNRRYVVRVKVDRGAALDVSQPNAFNKGVESLTNIEEAEFLVIGDQRGRIISVQRADALVAKGPTWAARNANAIRWGGRLLIAASVVHSAVKVATATPEERPKVLGQEVGGQVGGLGGGALATAGCVAFGIATEGAGLFLCGLLGGAVGGGLGSYAGGSAVDGLNSMWDEAYMNALKAQGDPIPAGAAPMVDSILGPALF